MTTSLKADSTNLNLEALREAQVDVSGAETVSVQHDVFAGTHRIWVNVNGVCVLRVCRAVHYSFADLNKKGT